MRIQFKWNKKNKIFDIIVDGKKIGTSKKSSLPLHELQKMLEPKPSKVKAKL